MKSFFQLKIIVLLIVTCVPSSGFAAESPLSSAIRRVASQVREGITPIAVFDLDETLILTHGRKTLAIREVLPSLQARFPEEIARSFPTLSPSDLLKLPNAYDLEALFASFGIHNREFTTSVMKAMLPVYLSSKFMDFDSEVPCATSFVRELMRAGAYPIFVSSRYQSTQGVATQENLLQLRFVDAEIGYSLILRDDGVSSIDFKRAAFKAIHDIKSINGQPASTALVFENEPENLNAMSDAFPTADAFFIKGAFLKDESLHAPAKGHLTRIRDYCE